jgi:hypothetical protein
MSEELRECPFCGSTATMRGGSDRASWIICDNKKCSATQGLELSGKNAVQMWNTRHTEDALKAEVGRLKKALGDIATGCRPCTPDEAFIFVDVAKSIAKAALATETAKGGDDE